MLSRMIGYLAGQHARRLLKRFQKKLARCQDVQQHLLLDILRTNQASDFGRKHEFARITNYTEYRQGLPLANYSYFESYIQKCRQGEYQALFGSDQKILMFALTSGTTARSKYIPITQAFTQAYRRGWEIWGFKAIFDHPDSYLRKILQVTSPAEESRTPAGIPCGSISGLLAKNQKKIVRQYYATPYEVAQIKDAAARYYTIMRFAIAQDVAFISTANPSTTLVLAQTAEKHAEQLIRDVRDGTLDSSILLPPELRKQLTKNLVADEDRAEELEEILQQHGRLLPQHYWDLSFLANWTGGSLQMYLPRLAEYFGVTPIRDIGLLASEGRMSIPLQDNTAGGVLDISSNFFEFVPQSDIDRLKNPENSETLEGYFKVLPAWEVEKGKNYYIFITNQAGLYRYNMGDLVQVTDFVDSTPVIKFISKGAHHSSITGEKLTEYQVVESVRTAAVELAIAVDNFVMAPLWSDPPRYMLYVVPRQKLNKNELKMLATGVDQVLGVNNMEYESKRISHRLDSIKVRQVSAEFLDSRDEQLRQQNQGRSEQFKHRFLYNEPIKIEKND